MIRDRSIRLVVLLGMLGAVAGCKSHGTPPPPPTTPAAAGGPQTTGAVQGYSFNQVGYGDAPKTAAGDGKTPPK